MNSSIMKFSKTVLKNLFSKKTKDKRADPRISKVFIAQCVGPALKSFTTVVNISPVGLGMVLDKPLTTNEEVTVILQHEFKNGSYDSKLINLSLPSKVIWVKEETTSIKNEKDAGQEKQFRVGLELLPLTKDIEARYNSLMNC